MNNYDLIQSSRSLNESLVFCKDCTKCLKLTNEKGGTTRFCRQLARTNNCAVMVSSDFCCADGFIFDNTINPKHNAEIVNEDKDISGLVRCKDCVYCRVDHQGAYDYYICDRLQYPNYPGNEGLSILVDSDFFCSSGITIEDCFEEEED